MNYCAKIRTIQVVPFKIMIEALKELLTDTSIEIDEDGIRIITMDTPHQVLVHMKLDAHKFEEYFCKQKIIIGVNMMNFHKIIKTINNNDQLTLFVEDGNMNYLGVEIENETLITQYKLDLLDLDNTVIQVDPARMPTVITMPSSEFQKICRDMSSYADKMEIKNIGNHLTFSCKGDFCVQKTQIKDNSSLAASGARNVKTPESDSSAIVQGVFSIKNLVLFTKCTNLSQTCEIYLKNDFPLIVRYSIANLGEIKLCLAPSDEDSRDHAHHHVNRLL